VTLSPWVNERLPSFQELLSAHDVARLTRRPKLILTGLMLLGRFPKKCRFRGRQIGWLRADVLDWMARGFTTTDTARPHESALRHYAKATAPQPCLPLECSAPCARTQVQPPCTARRKPRGDS
jgi:predicted DNA-binding transcriptional regulator AlpA